MSVDTLDLREVLTTCPPVTPRVLLVATVRPSRGLLARLAAVLSAHPVTPLTFQAPTGSGPARVEILVPAAHGSRVRAKLLRMVDVLMVLDTPKTQVEVSAAGDRSAAGG
jgi:hypothetical protein